MMSYHCHVVLRVNRDKSDSLTDREVVDRWLTLNKGAELAQRYQAGESLDEWEEDELNKSICDENN